MDPGPIPQPTLTASLCLAYVSFSGALLRLRHLLKSTMSTLKHVRKTISQPMVHLRSPRCLVSLRPTPSHLRLLDPTLPWLVLHRLGPSSPLAKV